MLVDRNEYRNTFNPKNAEATLRMNNFDTQILFSCASTIWNCQFSKYRGFTLGNSSARKSRKLRLGVIPTPIDMAMPIIIIIRIAKPIKNKFNE